MGTSLRLLCGSSIPARARSGVSLLPSTNKLEARPNPRSNHNPPHKPGYSCYSSKLYRPLHSGLSTKTNCIDVTHWRTHCCCSILAFSRLHIQINPIFEVLHIVQQCRRSSIETLNRQQCSAEPGFTASRCDGSKACCCGVHTKLNPSLLHVACFHDEMDVTKDYTRLQ
jgi:hypothetical protein